MSETKRAFVSLFVILFIVIALFFTLWMIDEVRAEERRIPPTITSTPTGCYTRVTLDTIRNVDHPGMLNVYSTPNARSDVLYWIFPGQSVCVSDYTRDREWLRVVPAGWVLSREVVLTDSSRIPPTSESTDTPDHKFVWVQISFNDGSPDKIFKCKLPCDNPFNLTILPGRGEFIPTPTH